MHKKILITCFLTLLCSATLFANPLPSSIPLDTHANIGYIDLLEKSSQTLKYLDQEYPLYTFLDTLYISLDTLEEMGCTLNISPTCISIHEITTPSPATPSSYISKSNKVYFQDFEIYIKGIKVYALLNDETLFIPLSSLSTLGELDSSSHPFTLLVAPYQQTTYMTFTEDTICNLSDYLLRLNIVDILWDDETCIENKRIVLLPPQTALPKKDFINTLSTDVHYMTSYVEAINGIPTPLSANLLKDLKNHSLFSIAYTNRSKYKKLNTFFKPTHIQATLKYPAGKLKAKEQVHLLWAEKRSYYVVQDTVGREHLIPWDSLDIQGKDWYATSTATEEQIQDYINIGGFDSETDYLVWTDLARQRTYVLKKDNHTWKLEKNFICATGKDRNPTPSGLFKFQYAIPYFGTEHGYRCKNALVFFKDYMYHSVVFDKTGKYITKGQLGTQASSGCVRLSEADSRWLYKNIPLETTVWIH